jgi:glutathione S-transferase
MPILYEHPLSPYVQKVKIALGEKGVAFESRMPDILAGSDAEQFLRINPRLEVPTLVDGDHAIFDSTIILEYVEERWPEPALLPAAPAERARARMIEEVCDTYYEAINWAIMEIRAFGRATGESADRLLARANEQTAGVQAWLSRQLGSQPWPDRDHARLVGFRARGCKVEKDGSAITVEGEAVELKPIEPFTGTSIWAPLAARGLAL